MLYNDIYAIIKNINDTIYIENIKNAVYKKTNIREKKN